MPAKKDSEKSEAEKDAGVEVPVAEQEHSGATSEPISDFDKHTEGVEPKSDPEPSEDEPHGHPFQPDAEPILVTEGSGRGQMTKSARKNDEMVKISPEEAYDDPEFNPVAAAETPGHRGGPQAEGGTERATPGEDVKEAIDTGHDEKAENLDYDWKGTNPGEADAK